MSTAGNALSFGRWLRVRREASGLSQEAVARLAGVTRAYLSRLENAGFHSQSGSLPLPRVAKVDALAKALGAPVDEARLAAGYAPINAEMSDVPLQIARIAEELSPEFQVLLLETARVFQRQGKILAVDAVRPGRRVSKGRSAA